MMEIDKYLEVYKTVHNMAQYLKDNDFDFVITAKQINPEKFENEFILSCTREKEKQNETIIN